jgi:hypothetical protein
LSCARGPIERVPRRAADAVHGPASKRRRASPHRLAVPDGRVRTRPEQNRAECAKADAERERQPQTSAPGDL